MLDNSDKVSQNLPIQLHAVNLNDKSYVYRMVKQTNLEISDQVFFTIRLQCKPYKICDNSKCLAYRITGNF